MARVQTEFGSLPDYPKFSGTKNTSLLNAYLSAGCISPRLLAAEGLANRHFEWLDKLIFRDYCYQLAYHRRLPETTDAAPVREYWRNGQTGVPVIDASIRSLVATGHLHPILQQLCAHYFCHALNLDPNQGIAWTASVQTGTDPALNQANWHLAAQDTATVRYAHRSHQIDPDGSYIRSYLPNWRTCRPPSSTRRGPPPMTSTHTATPSPRPSETYVHTKKPH